MTVATSQPYRARSHDAGQTCSICQTEMIRGEWVTRCGACGLVYHAECWQENSGCAQYGCRNAPETEKADAPDLQSNVWGEEKTCPQCGKRIKAVALKCRYCGAIFDTRDFVSQTEFSRRAYQDKEYSFARAWLVALFLISVTGCLSPVALVLHLVLRYGGRLGGQVEFARLPDELKALNLIGLIVSGVLVGMGVLVILLQSAS